MQRSVGAVKQNLQARQTLPTPCLQISIFLSWISCLTPTTIHIPLGDLRQPSFPERHRLLSHLNSIHQPSSMPRQSMFLNELHHLLPLMTLNQHTPRQSIHHHLPTAQAQRKLQIRPQRLHVPFDPPHLRLVLVSAALGELVHGDAVGGREEEAVGSDGRRGVRGCGLGG